MNGRQLVEAALNRVLEGRTGQEKRHMREEVEEALRQVTFTGTNFDSLAAALGQDHPVVQQLQIVDGRATWEPHEAGTSKSRTDVVGRDEEVPSVTPMLDSLLASAGDVGLEDDRLSEPAGSVLATLVRILGSEAQVVQWAAAASPTEIDSMVSSAGAQVGADPNGVSEARALVYDRAAEARAELTSDPGTGSRRRVDSPEEVRRITESRRAERNRLLREEEQRRMERQRRMLPFNRTDDEIREAQNRASGLYRYLLSPDDPGYDPQGPDIQARPDEPLGGGRAIPVNEDREIQRRAGQMAGAATPDRAARAAATVPDVRVPLYFAGDEYAPAGWTEQRIADMQRRLVEAGLLRDTFRRGYWDRSTADAYAALLIEANQTGDTWRDALPHVQRAYEQGIETDRANAIRSFQGLIPAYTPEDRESLRQTVRDAIRRRVGRDPSAAELATYTAELDAHYRAQYDTEVAEARRRIEEQISQIGNERDVGRAILDGAPPAPTVGDLPVPAANAPAVDPQARLDAALDRALAGEVELLDDKAQAAQSQQTVSQIAGGLLRRVR